MLLLVLCMNLKYLVPILGPKKSKLKQRRKDMSNKGAKDMDMMSAFVDKPEEEVSARFLQALF